MPRITLNELLRRVALIDGSEQSDRFTLEMEDRIARYIALGATMREALELIAYQGMQVHGVEYDKSDDR